MPRLLLALAAVLILPFLVSTAHADPAGQDHAARRRSRPAPAAASRPAIAKGETYVVRRGGSAKAKAKRTASGARWSTSCSSPTRRSPTR